MQAIYLSEGETLDYTPVSAVGAGDVVVVGTRLVCIAKLDIAAGELGGLCTRGRFRAVKVTGAFAAGAPVYWDADGNPLGGSAGTGVFTDDATKGPFAGFCGPDGAAETDADFELILQSIDAADTLARADLVQDDAAVYDLPLEDWLVTGTGAKLGNSAGTPSGAFGLTMGTAGSAAPKIVGEAASGNTKTNKMRRSFTLPPEYVAGQSVTLRIKAVEAVGEATVSTTVDAIVHKCDKAAGVGADLCATNLQDVTAVAGNKDFTITPTSLGPGDRLDIEITGVTTDTGGTVGTILTIVDACLLLDVKG